MHSIGLSILVVTALLAVTFCWKRAGGMISLTMTFLSLAVYWSFSVMLSDGAKSWVSAGMLLWIAGFACFVRVRLIGRAALS
ncbi:hypothetical protein LL998_34055 (plasmid) [Burkholderia ambifaria]|uniref:hypothetical protein n=1 Tax=Burkholderia ambifaria TaxID=152480 RepID=UPI001E47F7DE|nr:hypothetical protein [Burkholderia ambifaria]UEP39765.1 hypothetical protein LL998_34055 [Burkholderia ambifaria]